MSEFGLSGALSDHRRMRSVASTAPIVGSDHIFEIPAKLIKTPADMKIWEKSEAYFEYLGFVLAVNEAIKGKSNSRGSEKLSQSVIKVGVMLDKLDARIDETPPIQQPQRFGNIAFRTWYQKMRDDSLLLLQEVLREELYKAIPEIVSYLVDCFGNSTRIDYGTGHELSFIMFMCCLFKIGLLRESDKVATGCYIFPKYLDMVRKLQKTYRMEPAGSHGVWSLDDYQFVPFIWGSSQLFAHPTIKTYQFVEPQILNDFGEDYMFLTCIQYINSVKSGPFPEHSNQLWSISGVSSWSKINAGLVKMYKAEVLSKFPVVQHVVFGSLFTLKPMEQAAGLMTPRTSMVPPPVPYSPSVSTQESSESSTEKSKDGERSIPSSETIPSMDITKEDRNSPEGEQELSIMSSKASEKSDVIEAISLTSRESEAKEITDSVREPSEGSSDSDGKHKESIPDSVRFSTEGGDKIHVDRGRRAKTAFNVGERGPTPI